jgi:biotin synthase
MTNSGAVIENKSSCQNNSLIRNDWTLEEIRRIYEKPVLELIFQAASIHRQFHDPLYVQKCTLLSIKTGACPEDCAYCPQSARYTTNVKPEPLMDVASVLKAAHDAKDNGSSRFCMGAAWREVKNNQDFENVLNMVKEVSELGLEVCVTLGMLNFEQAQRLKEAGLTAYNHNLDSSSEYYEKIITTRTYQDRLNTLNNVAKAGIDVCCGGIVGMGESQDDRIELIHTLATLPEHPESVPVNALVPVEGTPLAQQAALSVFDFIRMIATARITMPAARVRLSAGRTSLSIAEQTLCFMAGANSIFAGEKLLTTPNCGEDQDQAMFDLLGITSDATPVPIK